MTETTSDELERALVRDLEVFGDRFRDEQFSTELYRALTNTTWRKRGGPEGHLALSWSRAERIVNALRERHDDEPLALAQTGGEGEVSNNVHNLLEPLGWSSRPLDTSRHDDAHVSDPEDVPRQDDEPPEWERKAHTEADENRR